MNSKKILLTAFQGTSAQLLIHNTKNYQTLMLPNDKVKDSELLIEAILKETFDYVISFGQRPNIKDKVHIETTAGEGEFYIDTSFDCDKLNGLFEQKGLTAKLSHNAGTSFCNKLYLNGLQYILQNDMVTQMVFVHVPFKKNITDFDSFREKIFEALAELE